MRFQLIVLQALYMNTERMIDFWKGETRTVEWRVSVSRGQSRVKRVTGGWQLQLMRQLQLQFQSRCSFYAALAKDETATLSGYNRGGGWWGDGDP